MRRALRRLGAVLVVAGALLVADAVVTLAWQEPLSALYTGLRQDALGGELRALERRAPTTLERGALRVLRGEQRRTRFAARALDRRAGEGDAVGRIRIPRLGADFVVVDGTGSATLRKGPGLFPQTPFPGAGGTVAIAGHRSTYGSPFRHIDDLRAGDRVTLDMPYARLRYAVEGTRIVRPTAIGVIRRVRGGERLVLSACHPLFSARQRIVVFARLVATEPRPRRT